MHAWPFLHSAVEAQICAEPWFAVSTGMHEPPFATVWHWVETLFVALTTTPQQTCPVGQSHAWRQWNAAVAVGLGQVVLAPERQVPLKFPSMQQVFVLRSHTCAEACAPQLGGMSPLQSSVAEPEEPVDASAVPLFDPDVGDPEPDVAPVCPLLAAPEPLVLPDCTPVEAEPELGTVPEEAAASSSDTAAPEEDAGSPPTKPRDPTVLLQLGSTPGPTAIPAARAR